MAIRKETLGGAQLVNGLNTRYPGRPDYVGPTKDILVFGLHHDEIIEWTWDVEERLHYINTEKPKNERAIRRRVIARADPTDSPLITQLYELRQQSDDLRQQRDVLWQQGSELWQQAGELWRQSIELIREHAGDLLDLWRALVPDLPWQNGKLVLSQHERRC